MGVIADILTEAGHDVTVLMPLMDMDEVNRTGVKLTTKIIRTPQDPRVEEWMKYKSSWLSHMWTMQPSVFALMKMAQNMTDAFAAQCEALITDDALMKKLADEKFDVGIAEAFSICGLGIIEALKIPSSIATFSGVHMDIVSKSIGEPIVPSYVPGHMATKGDRMNLIDRLMNVADMVLGQKFFGDTFIEEIKVLRAKYGQRFKDYEELLADASYVFTNSNPYLDYPRPMLHKTVPLGGITVHIDPMKNVLPKKWDDILNERNTTVFVSFGSVAKSMYMPDEYKKNLLKVFESMPETTFIWKYEEEGSKLGAHLKNVHLSTWAPQNALLADPRLTVFITHGGLGSTTELAHLGKPAILMPIFADQTRNANMLAKHGGGIVLTKFALENPQIIKDALKKIFNDKTFSQNAKRLSEMLRNQPINTEELLIRYSEFAAKFGRLPNLDPYGRHLSFIEYFLIDIFLVVGSIVVLVAFIAFKIIRRCFTVEAKSKTD
uniref:UDP-glucuronosyltransferase n=1 Tax=Haemonchus contortus TaxID=6289 RepID=A0A7I4YPX6_HAECO